MFTFPTLNQASATGAIFTAGLCLSALAWKAAPKESTSEKIWSVVMTSFKFVIPLTSTLVVSIITPQRWRLFSIIVGNLCCGMAAHQHFNKKNEEPAIGLALTGVAINFIARGYLFYQQPSPVNALGCLAVLSVPAGFLL
ncbi:MAG: hypothetical protein LVR00_07240 [Rhabdochlamydiaceae bacterium]|jgi:hypothetical protein